MKQEIAKRNSPIRLRYHAASTCDCIGEIFHRPVEYSVGMAESFSRPPGQLHCTCPSSERTFRSSEVLPASSKCAFQSPGHTSALSKRASESFERTSARCGRVVFPRICAKNSKTVLFPS